MHCDLKIVLKLQKVLKLKKYCLRYSFHRKSPVLHYNVRVCKYIIILLLYLLYPVHFFNNVFSFLSVL